MNAEPFLTNRKMITHRLLLTFFLKQIISTFFYVLVRVLSQVEVCHQRPRLASCHFRNRKLLWIEFLSNDLFGYLINLLALKEHFLYWELHHINFTLCFDQKLIDPIRSIDCNCLVFVILDSLFNYWSREFWFQELS